MVYKFRLSQWLIVALCLGLQGKTAAVPAVNNILPSTHNSLPISPFPHLPLSVSSSPSSKCPTEVETLIPLMLRDLPNYANRVMQRSRRLSRTSGSMSYVITAGRPEFEPLTLGPGQYTPPTATVDLEPPQQVFFTTLERQYRGGKALSMQLYHWLFLSQTPDGWRVSMMFSRFGSSSGGPPTPPQESSRGVVGQAVKLWLRDCRAGAIRRVSPPSIQTPNSKI